MSAEAKNLEAIAKAIDRHNRNCPVPAVAVHMNPFEVERLGWTDIKGLPIVGDPKLATGRFRVVCGGDKDAGNYLEAEAVAEQVAVEVEREGDLLKVH